MAYIKAVLKKDNNEKIKSLENLIILGKKLNKNTKDEEAKLYNLKKTATNITKEFQEKKIKKIVKNEEFFKYSIKNIKTSNNSIIIDFNKSISQKDINFFELRSKKVFKDIFDIQGNISKTLQKKLFIKGINKVYIGQYKKNIVRIVLANKINLTSSFSLNKKQMIIRISGLEEKPQTKTFNKKQIKPKYIDKKNFIRSIYSSENTIIIKFNKNLSKKHFKYSNYKYKGKYEDVFDINGNYAYTSPTKLQIKGLDKIIVSKKSSNKTRIRISDKRNLKIIYKLKRRELQIIIKNLNNKEKKKEIATYSKPFISKTIVIDPGHGKRDVGAVGPNKRYEKVVTLKVAKQLYKILKAKGHKVFLTRTGDSFIKVNNRTILANKKHADIFISVHANSVPKSKAHKVQGVETFFLSPARNERAKRVAAKENKSDIRRMSSSTKQVFLESLNRPRITASHKLAIDVQAGLLQSVRSSYKNVKDSGVREGPFWVLVGAQMPSILIELGYISHPIESKRLYSSRYQRLLANGIANGVDSYFSKNP